MLGIVAQNSMLQQFAGEFLQLYLHANVLVADDATWSRSTPRARLPSVGHLRRLSLTKQAAAQTIAVLFEHGDIAREDDPNDRRRKRIDAPLADKVTRTGEAILEERRRRRRLEPGEGELEALKAGARMPRWWVPTCGSDPAHTRSVTNRVTWIVLGATMWAVFDVEDFVQECRAALAEEEPRRGVREVVERAVGARSGVADTLRPQASGFTLLHHDADLTVLHVVWAPRMSIYPHDHRMWAVIGVYAGEEDNRFFRRGAPGARTLTESGGKLLGSGEVAVLGVNTIHAVTNPRDRLTAAIHVYGGDFVNQPRSQWGPGSPVERPYDIAEAQRQFDEANAAWQTGAGPW